MSRWQVFGAVALRKLPQIVPRKNAIELKVQEIFNAYEIALSKLSSHELQHLEDIRAKEDADIDVIIKETAQDKEDKWLKEKSTFEFGKHDERLACMQYLFMNQKFGSDIKDQWLLPQAEYDPSQDSDLLDTIRRALRENLNLTTGYKVFTRIPSSVYSFRYPKKIVQLTGHHGAKVFFLKAHLDNPSGAVSELLEETKNSNLKWLTNKEAFSLVKKKYMISFSEGLLHEKSVPKIHFRSDQKEAIASSN